jgi:hypothetical protein
MAAGYREPQTRRTYSRQAIASGDPVPAAATISSRGIMTTGCEAVVSSSGNTWIAASEAGSPPVPQLPSASSLAGDLCENNRCQEPVIGA